MKCSSCGFENAEGNKFCKKCGSKLEVPQTPKFCRSCGKAVTPGNLYCVGCGKPIQGVEPAMPPVNDTPIPVQEEASVVKEKGKKPIAGIVIAVVAVVALLLAGVWVISNKDTNKDKDETPQENPTQYRRNTNSARN